jgi:hypothetical protein
MPSPLPIGHDRGDATGAMRQFLGISGVVGILLLLIGNHVGAETPPARYLLAPIGKQIGVPLLHFALGDTVEIVAHRRPSLGSHWSPATSVNLMAPKLQYQRSLAFFSLTHVRTYERSRLARTIYGADQFAGTAAALGGLGLIGGVWDGKTAGYFMGAGAVLGALWGGTLGADNPRIRIGVDQGPLGPEIGRRSPRIAREHD